MRISPYREQIIFSAFQDEIEKIALIGGGAAGAGGVSKPPGSPSLGATNPSRVAKTGGLPGTSPKAPGRVTPQLPSLKTTNNLPAAQPVQPAPVLPVGQG